MAAPLIIGGAMLAGSALNAWLTWQGAKKGEAAQNKANRLNMEMFREQQATEVREKAKDRRFQEELQRQQFGQRNFESFLDHITTMFNSRPSLTQNLVALQRTRGR